jgi:hypothetical protein
MRRSCTSINKVAVSASWHVDEVSEVLAISPKIGIRTVAQVFEGYRKGHATADGAADGGEVGVDAGEFKVDGKGDPIPGRAGARIDRGWGDGEIHRIGAGGLIDDAVFAVTAGASIHMLPT